MRAASTQQDYIEYKKLAGGLSAPMLVINDIMVAHGVEWQLSTGQLVAWLEMDGDGWRSGTAASEIAHDC